MPKLFARGVNDLLMQQRIALPEVHARSGVRLVDKGLTPELDRRGRDGGQCHETLLNRLASLALCLD
jgi:hypothetical protein